MHHLLRQLSRSAALTVLAVATLTSVGFAQKRPDAQALKAIGDGAAACAAAKKAAALRAPQREQVSIASANFDATFYHLDLFVGMVDDTIQGTVRVEGRVVNATLSTLKLDLASSMKVSSVKLPDGTPLSYTHPRAALNITLPAPATPGSAVAVDITYRGVPVSDGFGNFVFGFRTTNGDRYAWSLSEPYGAREWWPCKDHPSDKADSVRVTVTVPSEYRVGSQGLLVSETTVGPNTTYDWLSHYPVSSYLVSVAIGKYVRYQGTYDRPAPLVANYGPLSLPLDHLVYNDASHDLPAGWAEVSEMLAVEEAWFGPYPFANEKYGHSEFTFGGGMEHQTMTSIGGSAVAVVSHELAHQWYGDMITPKQWKHLWLSEGFATYAELLYFQAREDVYPGYFEAVLEGRMASARQASGTLVLQDTTDVNEMFDGYRVYAKGGVVMHMLRYVMGDFLFQETLRAYSGDPAVQYGNATTADFQRDAELVSGLDLQQFFDQWVRKGTGYPKYGSTSTFKGISGGYHMWVTIAQGQREPDSNVDVFVMPVEIATYVKGVEIDRRRVDNNRRSQVFEFDVMVPDSLRGMGTPTTKIDPDMNILRNEFINNISQKLPSYPKIAAMGPNPTSGVLQLQYLLDRQSNVEIKIYDVAGRRVLTQNIPAVSGVQFADIDTSDLASGVYFLRLSTPRGHVQQKFVVVR